MESDEMIEMMESYIESHPTKKVEVIDGVSVVHTGDYDTWYLDGKPQKIESLEMYDANGNRAYSNCSSLEEAEQMVKRLEAEGKTAIIGRATPVISHDGSVIPNNWEGSVGVYLVSEEKEQSNTPRHR